MTPLYRFRRAGAAMVCFGLLGATSASAFDLNPFHIGAAPQTAQSDQPPGTIPGAGPDSADPAAVDVRVDRLEDELRQANGRIEELQNQQRRLEDMLKRIQQDVEFRLGGAGAAGATAAAPMATPPATAPAAAPEAANPVKTARKNDAFDPAADPNAPGAPRQLGTTTPSAPLAPGGAPLDLSGKPVPPATPAGPLTADAGPKVITGTGVGFTDGPRDQYNVAFESYRAGQYAQAEEQFKAFLAANATHRLAPDAIFYLGETYFQRQRPREAAEEYLKLSTDFSRSTRAPEGMLRLGQSLALLGSREQACATFAEVGRRYPTAASAVRRTAEREMQKDHC